MQFILLLMIMKFKWTAFESDYLRLYIQYNRISSGVICIGFWLGIGCSVNKLFFFFFFFFLFFLKSGTQNTHTNTHKIQQEFRILIYLVMEIEVIIMVIVELLVFIEYGKCDGIRRLYGDWDETGYGYSRGWEELHRTLIFICWN